MIKPELLDKRHTYILLEYGTSAISKLIQKFTKEYYPEAGDHIPTHVLALSFEDGIWRVYESHMKPEPDVELPSGVRTYPLDILKQAFPSTYYKGEVYQVRFDRRKLKNYLGQPYGIGDIASLMGAAITNRNGKQQDRRGLVCSEYLALAHKNIRKYLYLKSHCITPIHWLKYLQENHIPRVS